MTFYIQYIRFYVAELKSMNILKNRFTTLLFWGFIVALVSSISTTIFSESSFNDNFAFSIMACAFVGIVVSVALLMVDAILEICNP